MGKVNPVRKVIFQIECAHYRLVLRQTVSVQAQGGSGLDLVIELIIGDSK